MTSATKKFLKDYRPAPFVVDSIDLKIDIEADQTLITSKLKIQRTTKDEIPLVFDMGPYEITSVIADGMILLENEYQADQRHFRLESTPETFELEISNILHPETNTSLEGLYTSGNIICSQCEAEGFRNITPFPDRPDVMAKYTCTLVADKDEYPVLLSNGNLIDSGDLDKNRHYVRWEDPHRKPSYLFAVVAGDLAWIEDRFTTASGRNVDLKIYSEKAEIEKCHHAMASLKQSMAWDEERFGLEYDLDLYQIVAINDFNAGAMENKGLNIFNAKYIMADPTSATDEDFMNIQAVVGHEYFHNWTGNRVTLKNWFQLSLKEGLTVFRDQEFSSDLNSRSVQRIKNVKMLRAYQFPEDSGPMAHPVRPDSYIKMDNFYTMTVYEKGAELIRMIHLLLGESDFQRGIKVYFQKFDGMAVTVEEFLSSMEEASGKDLQSFKTWYVQSGTPHLSLSRHYDKKTQTLTLEFRQQTSSDHNQAEKKQLPIPIRLGLISPNGEDITPQDKALFILDKKKDSITFNGVPQGSIPSVLRGFSAPVILTSDLSNADLAHLMANDSDEFNRWEAAQTLFIQELKTLIEQIQNQKEPSLSPELFPAIEGALNQRDTDKAFLAKVIELPQETEIKDHYKSIDVDAILSARAFLKRQIAEKFEFRFMDIVKECATANPSSLRAEDIAKRALKNKALSYLGSLDHTQELIEDHFKAAQNMTDEYGALRILTEQEGPCKKAAVDAFYNKWSQDKLVLDKWFTAQAISHLPDTLDHVKQLMDHPDFSLTNPNKVRALIHAFAMHNFRNFHAKDGGGYAFIREVILKLDALNPQVTARLASCFNLWKRYDGVRREQMKKNLEIILAHKDLSKNVYEIVSRALDRH